MAARAVRLSVREPERSTVMSSFVRHIHFVGIGGVGMSGIARVLLNLGYRVSGSDAKMTELTKRLARDGAKVYEGHKASNGDGAQVVVVSSAVKPGNPEVAAARRRGIPVVLRAEMLAEVARLKKTVTVSGSHGKTTTTSMASMALAAAGADPTMIIGGQLKNIGGNARLGLGPYLVAEADESDGSFQFLTPVVAIVTNVDNDHLDHYKTMANLKAAFVRHLQRVPFYGAAVLCADDKTLAGLFGKVKRPIISYGIDAAAEWRARNIEMSSDGSRFDLYRRGRNAGFVRLRVPGRHNVLNALAAVAAGAFLGFDLKKLIAGVSEFRGVGRRLERLGEAGGVTFLDDYGHHPTEIRVTLDAVAALYCGRASRQYDDAAGGRMGAAGEPGAVIGGRKIAAWKSKGVAGEWIAAWRRTAVGGRKGAPACGENATRERRLVVVFQPHRYTRTKLLQKEFGPAFRRADAVYVTDIYPAGEKPIAGIDARLVLRSLKTSGVACHPFTRVVDLARELKPGDVLLTIGAGDVWKIGEDLRRRLKDNTLAAY